MKERFVYALLQSCIGFFMGIACVIGYFSGWGTGFMIAGICITLYSCIVLYSSMHVSRHADEDYIVLMYYDSENKIQTDRIHILNVRALFMLRDTVEYKANRMYVISGNGQSNYYTQNEEIFHNASPLIYAVAHNIRRWQDNAGTIQDLQVIIDNFNNQFTPYYDALRDTYIKY